MLTLLLAIFVWLKQLEIFVAEITKRTEDRIGCGLPESAEARVFNQIAKLLQLLHVFESSTSLDDLR